jgi:hypothetical protein
MKEPSEQTRAERMAILAAIIRGVVAGCLEDVARSFIDLLMNH